jgi:hypothetical protein
MSILIFPSDPTAGQVYAPNGLLKDHWVWSATGNYWRIDEVEVTTLNGISGNINIEGSGSVTVNESGQTITIGGSFGGGPGPNFVESINGKTGPVSFDDQQFDYDSAVEKFALSRDYFKNSSSVTDGLLFRSPVSTETNRQGLLSSGATSATNIAETVGNQQTTTSTTKILLVDGTPDEERYGNIGGATATIISTRYYNGADITVYGYKSNNSGSTIRKFMVLYDVLGVTFGYTEYANLSMGSNIGTFTLEATGGSWGLCVTPASTDQTIFSVRSTMYAGTNEIV